MDAYNYDMANFTMTTQYSMMYDPTILMAYGNFEVDWNTLMYTKFLGLNESAFGKENINWEDETRNKNAITNQYNVSVRGGSEKQIIRLLSMPSIRKVYTKMTILKLIADVCLSIPT